MSHNSYAKQIFDNFIMSSDVVSYEDCYQLCADKSQINMLMGSDHQVIWGRRGTGKTTLQKAFTHYVNNVQSDSSLRSIYVMIAKMIPTTQELDITGNEDKTLPVYIFSKFLAEVISQLEQIYNQKNLKKKDDDRFIRNYVDVVDIINNYRKKLMGLTITVNETQAVETQKGVGYNFGVDTNISPFLLNIDSNIKSKFEKTYRHNHSLSIQGALNFSIETQAISEKMENMITALGISRLYICIDEYAEMDKVSEFSVQSAVAQLIKQVFFKSPFFSIKISTIWNHSKLHDRGENKIQGIEYKHDIFPGPDLDIMFMKNNNDVIRYFKNLLLNTYALNHNVPVHDFAALGDFFENHIFGAKNLRCLICGSQGISRTFVVMAKQYLSAFLEGNGEPLKISTVYDMIKNQYIENVRIKIPHLMIDDCIQEFIYERKCRYFLISRNDYQRCKSTIKQLSTMGAFIQLPSHLTAARIRGKYKLFIINYGYYLEVMEESSRKKGIKILSEDGSLTFEDMLFPPCPEDLLNNPKDYCVTFPINSENEVYCPKCQKSFIAEKSKKIVDCDCGNKIYKFNYFSEIVAL
ncbi:MAG: hypothetical protein IJD74_06210 [Clostridia bacterium]|nr:hypothetical protein [Clostridia bacterium]